MQYSKPEICPINLASLEGIQQTYAYYRQLESEYETSLQIHAYIAGVMRPVQAWLPGAKDTLLEHQEEGGRTLWLPEHTSDVNLLAEAAAAYRDKVLRFMIGRVSILTDTDWYDKPVIGGLMRSLYDSIPAIPISRHPDQVLKNFADAEAIATMSYRMIHKNEDGVLYISKQKMRSNPFILPPAETLSDAPEQIAENLRQQGVGLKLLVTGRWSGDLAKVRHSSGLIRERMVHSVIDVPEDLSQTRAIVRTEQLANQSHARRLFLTGSLSGVVS